MHALLVDDNPDDRALVERELRQHFPNLRTTQIIDAAGLEVALAHGGFDLLVTDHHLRWTDRLAVLRAVRSRHPDVATLMLIDTGDEDVAVDAMKAGLDDYFVNATGDMTGLALAARFALDKAAQRRAYRESEELASGVIETALDAFIRIDENGRVLNWNPRAEAIFGWTRDEALGTLVADLILPPEQREAHRSGLQRFLAGGPAPLLGRRIEVEALHRDGRRLPIELAITPYRGAAGYVFNAFLRDLTEAREADEHLRQAQRLQAVGQLTGGLAHDFNNLLSVIIGNLDMARDRTAEDSPLRREIDMAMKSADRGAALTRQLLAFARRQSLRPTEIDVNALVGGMLGLLQRTLGQNIEVSTRLDPATWPVLADASQLENAVLNLAINARDAMPTGGRLIIESGNADFDEPVRGTDSDVAAGCYVALSVTDTGVGMSSEVAKRALEPFFTTKEVGRGSGLGLSMIYGFVKQSGGNVRIYSEVGHGTTVRLYLPRAQRMAQTDSSDERSTLLELARGELVLVVEDDAEVRQTVVNQLADLGYRTLEAADGNAAIELVRSVSGIDLLFADMIMPGGMTGREVAKAALDLRPDIRVLLTSGFSEALLQDDGSPATRHVLGKPYRRADLARKLRETLWNERR